MPASLTPKEQKVLDDLLANAVRGDQLAQVRLCVEKGANVNAITSIYPNPSYDSPLYHLLTKDKLVRFNEQISDYLLAHGVDVDVKDGAHGHTPLMLAVRTVNAEKTRYFLDKGANPFVAAKDGQTALEMAMALDNSFPFKNAIIEMLLKALPDATAPSAAPVGAAQKKPITVLKPIVFHGNKKPNSPGGGFRL